VGENSKIEWTHHTFSPWIGCQKVSPACANCYAEKETFVRVQRSKGRELWGPNGDRHRTSESYWKQPLKWNREAAKAGERRRVFCASLSDVFEDHPAIWPDWRADLGQLILDTPNLDWLMLTKRPENVIRMLPDFWVNLSEPYGMPKTVWIGTTVENQEMAEKRIPELLKIPATVKFLSCEPLLGPLDLFHFDDDSEALRGIGVIESGGVTLSTPDSAPEGYDNSYPGIDLVIDGGESGTAARPSHPDWFRSLRDQCKLAGVAYFHKQNGEYLEGWSNLFRTHRFDDQMIVTRVGKKVAGRLLDGVEHNGLPEVAR
jgi:protein gp37